MKKITLLGSGGSIGTQACDVIRKHRDKFSLSAIAVNTNIKICEEQIREFKPQAVAVFDINSANDLKIKVADTNTKVYSGMQGLCEISSMDDCDIVLNSVSGMIGLEPTLCAINAKKNIALANKETLVAGGELVMKKAKEMGVKILPVDSEHSAIFQCLQAMNKKSELNRIIITASGGPFFSWNIEKLQTVTPQMALKHPNWEMGSKITIDSATMMNKGLEVIEAKWLFDLDVSQIDVVVHRESVIHSLVEFTDNSVLAQLGTPDMTIPIQYALTYPDRYPSPAKQLNLWDYQNLSFFKPDTDTFKCLALAINAVKQGGLKAVALNGADEVAVDLFLKGKISFTDIADFVEKAMERQSFKSEVTLENILEADKQSREYIFNLVK